MATMREAIASTTGLGIGLRDRGGHLFFQPFKKSVPMLRIIVSSSALVGLPAAGPAAAACLSLLAVVGFGILGISHCDLPSVCA